MKIPNNIIITNKYTAGDEFVDPNTNKSYQGYYYELNGLFFKGQIFNMNAPRIIKKQNQNTLLNNPSTEAYSRISGITSQKMSSPSFKSIPFSPLKDTTLYNTLRYFAKQINSNPILIKEIDANTFTNLSRTSTPSYQVIAIRESDLVDPQYVEKQMSGLSSFLLG